MATLGDTTVVSLNVLNNINTSGTITGNGSGLTNLNGSNIATGTVPFASLPTGTTSTTVAIGNHTHTLSLAADTGTPTITLDASGTYKLTAGGNALIFKTPTDTKNTAGSTSSTSKLFLVGAGSQAASAQTYSNANIYMTDGTLYLVKTTDLSGTANNKPALIVGGADTSTHLELDCNEIHAKATGTTTAPLYLNHEGGNTYFSGEKTYSDGTYLYSNSTQVLTAHKNEFGKISDGTHTATADAVQDTITVTGSGATTVTVSDTNNADTITISSTDTKNTAGSTNSDSKLFIIGANSQAANPQTYSNQNVYIGTDHCLYSNGTKVLTAHQNEFGKISDGTTTTTASGVQDTITFAGSGRTSVSVSGKTVTISSTGDGDTKNTAGSSNSDSKLFLVGAGSQNATGVTTYSHSKVYATAGQLDATKFRVAEKATIQYNTTEDCIEFVFA